MSGKRAIVTGVERHANVRINSYKTATCDRCGRNQHELADFRRAAGLLRQDGWFVSGDRSGAETICPECVSKTPDLDRENPPNTTA